MTCVPDARTRARRAADELAALRPIRAVDTLGPRTGPVPRWTIDLAVDRPAALPPRVLAALARRGLGVRSTQPQHPYQQATAVVVASGVDASGVPPGGRDHKAQPPGQRK